MVGATHSIATALDATDREGNGDGINPGVKMLGFADRGRAFCHNGALRLNAASTLPKVFMGGFFMAPVVEHNPDSSDMIWRLARALYEEMEFLDPSNAPPWDDLSPRERDFYRFSVSHLLSHRAEMLSVLGLADNDMVSGGTD
jgi:hypothetical protein